MKRVDMESLVVVHSGETWVHQAPPCSRAMIRFLERNEDLVTWVQVCSGPIFLPERKLTRRSPRMAGWRTSFQ